MVNHKKLSLLILKQSLQTGAAYLLPMSASKIGRFPANYLAPENNQHNCKVTKG